MKRSTLLILWGVLFALCAGLGFLPSPTGALKLLCTGTSLLFFLPPALLLWQGYRDGHRETLKLIRNLSLLSLGLTLVLIIANVLSVLGSRLLGDILYALLVILAAPMICSRAWAISLFLWASLLMSALLLLKKRRPDTVNADE